MNAAVEIDTLSGAVWSTSSDLAQAAADLVLAEYRANERDLLEVVTMSLDEPRTGPALVRAARSWA